MERQTISRWMDRRTTYGRTAKWRDRQRDIKKVSQRSEGGREGSTDKWRDRQRRIMDRQTELVTEGNMEGQLKVRGRERRK